MDILDRESWGTSLFPRETVLPMEGLSQGRPAVETSESESKALQKV